MPHSSTTTTAGNPWQAAAFQALLISIVMFLMGCNSGQPRGPSPFVANPTEAGFAGDHDKMTSDKRFPFQKVWVDPTHVRKPRPGYIAPIDTNHIIHKPWFSQFNTRYAMADYKKDLNDIAKYSRDAIIKAFRADPDNKFTIVDSPEQAGVILELSLVELIPAEPALVAAGYIVPGPQLLNQPSVGFEGRVRRVSDNQVVACFAFRDQPDIAIVDVQNLKSWYDSNKAVIDKWAKLIVQVANDKYDPNNRQLIPVTLLSW